MSPPIDIDGSEIQRATIDGENVSEITIDGQQTAGFVDIPDSVVSRWQFNEGSGSTAIDSLDNYDGAINGATYTTNSAEGSHALDFDGSDDHVNIGRPSDLEWDGASMSISARVNFSSLSNRAAILTDRSGGAPWYIFRMNSSGEFHLTLNVDGSTESVETTATFDDGNYHFATLSYEDGGTAKIFVDGVEEASVSVGSKNAYSYQNDLQIGLRPGGRSPADGLIDDVSWANSALTLSEHEALRSA